MTRATIAAAGMAAIVAMSVAVAAYRSNAATTSDPAESVRAALRQEIDALDSSLVALGAQPTSHAAFRRARDRYKRLEGPLEFYAPALAAAFNSRRQEVDDDDAPPPSTLSPQGFPALESLLFSSERVDADSARRIVGHMRQLVERARAFVPALHPTSSQIIELTRLEIARVSSLGIAGFDSPVAHASAPEGASALDGLATLMDASSGFWPSGPDRQSVSSRLRAAARQLLRDTEFETFDRLTFIVFYANPAAVALDSLRIASHTTPIRILRAWRADAPSIYSPGAFDAGAYRPTTSPAQTSQLIAEGKRLFSDPTLSSNRTRSCASCHRPDRAFADAVARQPDLTHADLHVARSTPTLINAALQPAQFADARAASLEDQIIEVLRSPSEMGGTTATLAQRQALAAYVRSLTSFATRFDRAVQGDTAALSPEERRGFNVFMGKGACGTCHFAPLFSGVTPPLYLSSDVEVIGTTTSARPHASIDPDSGRARIDHLPTHLHAFKTPTLRNVARTAPYMHNGAFPTLDEVLDFYDRGGGRGGGNLVDNQTLSADTLHLSGEERHALIAFLRALSDEPTTSSPRSATPRRSDLAPGVHSPPAPPAAPGRTLE